MRVILLALLVLFPASAIAEDRLPMNQDPELERGLRLVAQGHFVRKYCDSVSPRVFRAYGLLNSLKSRAEELGYSEEEMEAYVDDPTEKARVEGLAKLDLEAMGAVFGQPDTFCDVAKTQIAAGRGFGWYFRYN